MLRAGRNVGMIRDFWSLPALIHGQKLGDSHEFEAFSQKRIKDLGHRFDRRRMDVMRQNNGTGARARDNAARDDTWTRALPIQRINIPQDDFVVEVVIYPYALPFRQFAIRRPHQLRLYADCLDDEIVCSSQLTTNGFV
jgi:hypothetical protein